MSRGLAFVSAAVLLLAVGAAGQVSTRRDGNWWNQQDAAVKLDYMVGFFDGTNLGYQFSYSGILQSSNGQWTACIGDIQKSFTDFNNKFFKNVSNKQIADGLDAFYKDYRNRSILVHVAVWIVVNSIAGTPQSELDKMIENWRKNASAE